MTTRSVLAALAIAAARGLRLPVVYNSSAYDAVGTLALLDELLCRAVESRARAAYASVNLLDD